MNLLGAGERERLLAAAWDEEAVAYPLPGYPDLILRPFSVHVLRRAATMGLACLSGDIRQILGRMTPGRALLELEALGWLLSAPLPVVRSAMRQRTWTLAMDEWSLPVPAHRPLLAELERVLRLMEAAMFDVEEKPDMGPKTGARAAADLEPPAHYVRPSQVAALGYALAEKWGRPVDAVLEWMPACQVFQMAHCLHLGDPRVWTVDKRLQVELAPEELAVPEPDPGYGEAIAF